MHPSLDSSRVEAGTHSRGSPFFNLVFKLLAWSSSWQVHSSFILALNIYHASFYAERLHPCLEGSIQDNWTGRTWFGCFLSSCRTRGELRYLILSHLMEIIESTFKPLAEPMKKSNIEAGKMLEKVALEFLIFLIPRDSFACILHLLSF